MQFTVLRVETLLVSAIRAFMPVLVLYWASRLRLVFVMSPLKLMVPPGWRVKSLVARPARTK